MSWSCTTERGKKQPLDSKARLYPIFPVAICTPFPGLRIRLLPAGSLRKSLSPRNGRHERQLLSRSENHTLRHRPEV